MNKHRVASVLGLTFASVLGLTSMTRPAVAFGADTALILGGSAIPVPPQSYVDGVEQLYLVPNGYGAYTPQALITPEEFYPITGVNSLPPDTSYAQGVTILDNAINQQIAAGNHVVVFGYSQSSAIASQEMAQLAASSNPPSPDQLSFVLVGDPSNPNGGILERFVVPGARLSLPSLGETEIFNYAPTVSNSYPTAVYTQEYDGFADFPQYPINLLADLNAFVAIVTQHFGYADLTPQQISSAIALPTTGNTTTQYYMIPTADLPLLAPVRLIPLIGNPLADLLQPDLRVVVSLGYGSITYGWSTGPANVPTPFGLFPTNINPADVLTALANGAVQGVTDALNDLKTPTLFVDTSSLSLFFAGAHTGGYTSSDNPSLLQVLAGFAALGNAAVPVTASGGIVNTLTSVVSNDIAVVKPLADTALAIGASLLEYDAQLFTSQLRAGHLVKAIGMPIAADVALVPYALLIGAIFPIVEAAATTVTQLAELAGLEPNPTDPPATTANATATAAAYTAAPNTAGLSSSLLPLGIPAAETTEQPASNQPSVGIEQPASSRPAVGIEQSTPNRPSVDADRSASSEPSVSSDEPVSDRRSVGSDASASDPQLVGSDKSEPGQRTIGTDRSAPNGQTIDTSQPTSQPTKRADETVADPSSAGAPSTAGSSGGGSSGGDADGS